MESFCRKRVRHFNDPGHAHELTFSCYKRLPLLSRDRSRWWLIEAIDRTRARLDYFVLCYVIMPEHVHLIILPKKADYNIPWFLKRVKQSVSRKAKTWLRENNPQWCTKLTISREGKKKELRFWQAGGGYDRNITSKRTLLTMIQYIHNNPVRRGLVSLPTEWKWSSAAWYVGIRNGPLVIDEIKW